MDQFPDILHPDAFTVREVRAPDGTLEGFEIFDANGQPYRRTRGGQAGQVRIWPADDRAEADRYALNRRQFYELQKNRPKPSDVSDPDTDIFGGLPAGGPERLSAASIIGLFHLPPEIEAVNQSGLTADQIAKSLGLPPSAAGLPKPSESLTGDQISKGLGSPLPPTKAEQAAAAKAAAQAALKAQKDADRAAAKAARDAVKAQKDADRAAKQAIREAAQAARQAAQQTRQAVAHVAGLKRQQVQQHRQTVQAAKQAAAQAQRATAKAQREADKAAKDAARAAAKSQKDIDDAVADAHREAKQVADDMARAAAARTAYRQRVAGAAISFAGAATRGPRAAGNAAFGLASAAFPEFAVPLQLAQAVGEELVDLPKRLRDFAESTVSANRNLAHFSGDVAQAYTRLHVHEFFRNRDLAARTEDQSVAVVKAVDRLRDSLHEASVFGTNVRNQASVFGATYLENQANALEPLFRLLNQKLGADPNADFGKTLADFLTKFSFLGQLEEIRQNLIKMGILDPDPPKAAPALGPWDQFARDAALKRLGGPVLRPGRRRVIPALGGGVIDFGRGI